MAGVERLYTPELLGLAVSLADYPLDATLPYQGSARSRSCGSTLDAGFALDSETAQEFAQSALMILGPVEMHPCNVGWGGGEVDALAGHQALPNLEQIPSESLLASIDPSPGDRQLGRHRKMGADLLLPISKCIALESEDRLHRVTEDTGP